MGFEVHLVALRGGRPADVSWQTIQPASPNEVAASQKIWSSVFRPSEHAIHTEVLLSLGLAKYRFLLLSEEGFQQ